MKFKFLVIVIFLNSQSIFAESCCGIKTPKAIKNEALFDSMKVESLWINGKHIDWQTGQTDRPLDYQGPDTHSHCSTFVAALVKKLNINILSPPEHPQTFLASAQIKWLNSDSGKQNGWIKLNDMKEAQTSANNGVLVIAAYESPIQNKPGHIAIIRPSTKEVTELNSEGPQIIQAGKFNYNSISLKQGFSQHKDIFPTQIQYFKHIIPD